MASEDIGNLFKTQIPGLEDAADIQAALKLYHYGSTSYNTNNDDPSGLIPNSVAGHFQSLKERLDALNIEDLKILATGENLNNKTVEGRYSQNSNTDARSLNSVNYPTIAGLAYAGILSVIVAENIIYQTYQTSGVPSGGSVNNALFFRSKTESLPWSQWLQLSDATHTHDDRYFTRSETTNLLNTKQNTITGAASSVTSTNLTASRAVASDANGKIQASAVTSAELAFLSGVTSGVQSQIDTANSLISATATKNYVDTQLANKANTSLNNLSSKTIARQNLGIFVLNPATFPNGPQQAGFTVADGDLWFW
jgi:hypothetical protein